MWIIVLPCDGIGPEITEAAIGVLDAIGKAFGQLVAKAISST